jgi:hypothetical protein
MSELTKTKALALIICSFLLFAGAALFPIFLFAFGGDDRPPSEGLPGQTDGVLNGHSEYHSAVKGYAISVPSDWTEVPSSIELGGSSVDVFYSLRATGEAGVSPTFSVSSESLPPKTTSREYLESKLDFLRSVDAEVAEPRAVEVGGVEGYLVDYHGYSRDYAVDTTSIVVVTDQQGWEFVLTVPSGERSSYRPLLAALLDSIRFPTN